MKKQRNLFLFLIMSVFFSAAHIRAANEWPHLTHLYQKICSATNCSLKLADFLPLSKQQNVVLASEQKPSLVQKVYQRMVKRMRIKAQMTQQATKDGIRYIRSKKGKRALKAYIRTSLFYGCTYGIPLGVFVTGIKYLSDQQQQIRDLVNNLKAVPEQQEQLLGQLQQASDDTKASISQQLSVLQAAIHKDIARLLQSHRIAYASVVNADQAVKYVKDHMIKKSVELEMMLDDNQLKIAKEYVVIAEDTGTQFTVVPVQVQPGWRTSASDMWKRRQTDVQYWARKVYGPDVWLAPYHISKDGIDWINP